MDAYMELSLKICNTHFTSHDKLKICESSRLENSAKVNN